MPRSRNIKPAFFKNEVLAELPFETRLLFIGLWTYADKEGRFELRIKKIKAELFPYDKINIEVLLQQLIQHGFLITFSVNNIFYAQIVNWHKHQTPHYRERESDIPDPKDFQEKNINNINNLSNDEATLSQSSTNIESTLSQDCPNVEPIKSLFVPLIPDSGFLIPDSLQTHCRASPTSRKNFSPDAITVLNFLNSITGKNFRPVPVNLDLIRCRLESGVTVQECKTVIARKWNDWKNEDQMKKYLRPSTLFNRTKFEQYLGEVVTKQDDES